MISNASSQRPATPTPESPATVRVRIAVIVDRFGEWVASGSSDAGESETVGAVSGILDNPTCLSWIEADVPRHVPTLGGTVGSSKFQQN